MKYKIVEKESFQVVGVKRTYNCQKSEHTQGIPVFWDDVHADGTNDLLFELNNGVIEGALGVCVADEAYKENYLIDYWIATAHTRRRTRKFISNGVTSIKMGYF